MPLLLNQIPPMTDPMGQYWKQPPVSDIELAGDKAYMNAVTFNWLAEYSCSYPSGVYEGKMWKRHDGLHDRNCPPEKRRWLLCWYGPSDDPKKCEIMAREIVIRP